MADGYLNFDTKINTDGFNRGLSAIGNLVKGAGSQVSALGKSFLPVTAAVTGVGAAAAKTTIDFTKLYESTMVVFEKMLGGKSAANELYDSLLSIATASTYSQEAFLTAGKKLVGMGVNAQDTTKYMQAITDAVAGFGGTAENLTNVAENFAKISTAGRLSMEDVNMLSDNGIQALKILGNQYGKTTDEIRDMISDGAIPAKDAMDKLAEGIEEGTDGVNGMTAAMKGMSLAMKGKTLTGALDSLNSGFRAFALNLTGINPTLKENDEGYEESTKRLQQLTAAISTVAGILPSLSSLFTSVTEGVGLLLDKLVGANVAFDEASGKWQNVGGILGTIQEKLESMDPGKLQQIGNVILGMAAAGAVLPVVGGGIGKVGNAVDLLGQVIAPVEKGITGLPETFQHAGKNMKPAVKSFGNLKDAILLPVADLPKAFQGVAGRLTDTLSSVSGKITGTFGKIGPTLQSRFPGISSALSNMGSYLGAWGEETVSALSEIPARLSESFGKIGSALQSRFHGISSALSNMGSYLGAWGGTVGKAFQGVVKSVGNFAPGFISMLKFGAIAGALVAGLGLLQGQFGDQIGAFLQTAAEKGPEVIAQFCNGISSSLPELITQGAVLIQNLLQAITANIPAIISGGVQIIAGLVTGIAQQLPTLVPMAIQMILTIVQSLLQNIPQLISAGLQLIMGLGQGLVNAIPMLISAAPVIIRTLVTGIVQNLPNIILVGIQLLLALVNGVVQAIPQLLAMIPEIFSAFVDGILSVDWLSVGKQILSSIVDGIKSIGTNLWNAVEEIFDDGEGKSKEKGVEHGQGYAQGIESTKETVQASASGVAQAGTDSYVATLEANSEFLNTSTMNYANYSIDGFQSAGVEIAFSTEAQAATDGVANVLNAGSESLYTSSYGAATGANEGVKAAGMPGTFAAEGVQAVLGLGASMASQTGTVSDAAGQVTDAAQITVSGADLCSAYSNVGAQAIQSLAGSITSSSPQVNSAANSVATAAITGLTSGKMPDKAKQEGKKFIQALSSSIKSGTGTVRSAVTSVMNAAKSAANGLSGSGYSVGQMFSAGIANGIRSGQYGIAAAAAQVANAAVQAAKQNLDINSPSKVGAWIGEMFDSGIAKGIGGNVSGILDSVGKMTGAIENGTVSALNALQRQALQGMTCAAGGRFVSYGRSQGQAADSQPLPVYVQTKATLVLQDGRVIAEVTTPYVDANIGDNVEKKGRYLK